MCHSARYWDRGNGGYLQVMSSLNHFSEMRVSVPAFCSASTVADNWSLTVTGPPVRVTIWPPEQ